MVINMPNFAPQKIYTIAFDSKNQRNAKRYDYLPLTSVDKNTLISKITQTENPTVDSLRMLPWQYVNNPHSFGEISISDNKALWQNGIDTFIKKTKDPNTTSSAINLTANNKPISIWRIYYSPPEYIVNIEPPEHSNYSEQDRQELSNLLQNRFKEAAYVTVVESSSKAQNKTSNDPGVSLYPSNGCCHKSGGCSNCLIGGYFNETI